MSGRRKIDGSLPDIGFMHLQTSPKSALIDTGTVLSGIYYYGTKGVPYNGTKPDIGCFESNYSLPVSMLSFGASLINKNTVSLSWETATELNNKGWEIERAELNTGNNYTWLTIGFTGGKDISNAINKYSFTDNNTSVQKFYAYRLKQIDYNGNYVYSNIVTIIPDYNNTLELNAFPNPARTSTTLRFNILQKGNVSMNLYTMSGVPVKQIINETMEEGMYSRSLLFDNLAAGNYIIRLNSDSKTCYVNLCVR